MVTLMIVEDEQLEREALRKIISSSFEKELDIVEDATNGREAIVKARKFCPDIILMDVGLPELNGIESQEGIIKFLPNVQTIVITAYSDFYYMQKAMQNKTVDYLLKPVRPHDLRKALTKVLNNIRKADQLEKQEIDNSIDTIRKAVDYIDHRYREKLSLEIIADAVHLNPQYLSRKFKQDTHIGVMEYINKKRMECAKDYLVNTDLPIYRIAQETGFSDAAHFSKVFMKFENQKPSVYRNMCS